MYRGFESPPLRQTQIPKKNLRHPQLPLVLLRFTRMLDVTHNAHEALSLGTRIVVLAKESTDQGSRVMLNVPVPQPCRDEEIPQLVLRVESVSQICAMTDEVPPHRLRIRSFRNSLRLIS